MWVQLPEQTAQARRLLGVVFQSPSTDKKLTVLENLRYQGQLYGLGGNSLQTRCQELLTEFEVADRAGDLVETLSGGLRRRVEVAKALLHRPRILLLDEPTTGLDPGARSTLWKHLARLREQHGVTVLATTHLLEEADRADRLGILDQGRLVALDTPDALRSSLGGDTITLTTEQPQQLVDGLAQRFDLQAQVADGQVRLALADGHQWISRLVEAFSGQIQAVTLGKPTLEDVFVARTGHAYHGSADVRA